MTKIVDRSETIELALDPENPEDREIARRLKLLAEILQLENPGDALRVLLSADEEGQAAAQEVIDSWPDFSEISPEFRSEAEQNCADLIQQMRTILREVLNVDPLDGPTASKSVN